MAVPGVPCGTAAVDHAEGAGRTRRAGFKLPPLLLRAAAAARGYDVACSFLRQQNLLRAATSWPRGWDSSSRREGGQLRARPEHRSGIAPWEPVAPRGTDHSHVSTAACEASTSWTDCVKLLQEGSLFCWHAGTSRNPVLISPSSYCK